MIRSVPLVAALWFVLLVGSANAWQQGERVAQRHCEHGHVLSCIHRAALHQRVSFGWLRGTAFCESRFNPFAVNGQYAGLFQFGMDAWSRSGYGQHSRFSAKWASLGAARMFRLGHSSEWSCA